MNAKSENAYDDPRDSHTVDTLFRELSSPKNGVVDDEAFAYSVRLVGRLLDTLGVTANTIKLEDEDGCVFGFLDEKWVIAQAGNPHISDKSLERILRKLDNAETDLRECLIDALLTNPQLPPQGLTHLVGRFTFNEELRRSILSHSSVDSDVLIAIIAAKEWSNQERTEAAVRLSELLT